MNDVKYKSAVVFAYHNVGVRCMQVLLAQGVRIAYLVTHQDQPQETIWFASVSELAKQHQIPVLFFELFEQQNRLEILIECIDSAQPDFIFSFYFRKLLPESLLKCARLGAYNMHGSLLPKYRGRVPVNWAILHGEQQTGVTLHQMVAKADAGAIIAQNAIPILPDDTAKEVFDKITVIAEQTLWQHLPALLAGTAPHLPNLIEQGSVFGARCAEDGIIDWQKPAQYVYNLIRATAPPFPGAFTKVNGTRFIITKARLYPAWMRTPPDSSPIGLQLFNQHLIGICGDRRCILIIEMKQQNKQQQVAVDLTAFTSLSL